MAVNVCSAQGRWTLSLWSLKQKAKDPIAVELFFSYLQMSSGDILLLHGSLDGKSETTVRWNYCF